MLGPDRALALQHVPKRFRAAIEALWLVDAAMGDVVARATDPTLAKIKLAWWREQLEKLDRAKPPVEPRLQAVAKHLLPIGISGAELAELEPGWETLLDESVDPELVADRGRNLFTIAGSIFGQADEKLADAGAFYALTMVARRGVPGLLEPARPYADRLKGHRFAGGLRSLTALARLAARDLQGSAAFEPEGSVRRALAMLAHRWSGIIVR